jgi:hypothetical protein
VVAEVALDGARYARHGVRRERGATVDVERVDRLHQRKTRNLLDVLGWLRRRSTPPRQLARQRQVALDQLLPRT